ncbi:MAG: gfo/Idh/MocA family oxidoreductase, partial [Acidobacteriota bacterium]|nr:gfo/Idh/MocA family oxidoreductase [Acidobacteriota bacterium]
VKQGYVGQVRGVHMTVSVDAFVPEMSEKHNWAFDASNFSNVLSIYAAHFGDMLFRSVGFPRKLTAVIETQFPFFTVVETGERIPNSNPNEVMVIGTLEGGGLFSMQVEGAQKHRTGLHIDISGTEGVLRITNQLAFLNKEDNVIEGMNGDATTFSPLHIPDGYQTLARSGLDVSAQDLAYLYAAYASDKKNGTSEASNFEDAVRQHRLIDEICKTSKGFFV